MKKSGFFTTANFIVIFLFAAFGGAQTLPDSMSNSLAAGSWSFQFKIEKDFTLSSFQGSNISAKKHFSRNSALRFGVSLLGSFGNSDQDEVSKGYINYVLETNSKANVLSLYFSGYYLYYPRPAKKINILIGAGPIFGYGLSDQKVDKNEVKSDTIFTTLSDNRDGNSWSLGISTIIGVEWFFSKHFSLVAEYGTSFAYSHSYSKIVQKKTETNQFDSVRDSEGKDNTYKFQANNIKFGISVYL